MNRRRVRPEELELWRKVAKSADPLRPDSPSSDPMPLPMSKGKKPPATPKREPIAPFEIGDNVEGHTARHDTLPGLPEQLASAPVKMDKKAYGRLKRGKLQPEGRIDLHGMTLDRAKPALTSFIMQSYARDRRLVLVITGKGKRTEDTGPIPVRPGVLRHNVPRWLQSPPLSQVVLQVTEAHARHGGGGAFYVYLRRKR